MLLLLGEQRGGAVAILAPVLLLERRDLLHRRSCAVVQVGSRHCQLRRPLLAGRNRPEQVGLGVQVLRDFAACAFTDSRCAQRALCAPSAICLRISRGRLSSPMNGTTTSPVPSNRRSEFQTTWCSLDYRR